MSEPCAIDSCKRASRALCHCCQQNLCIVHLNEHNEALNSQLNPLVDEINELDERFRTRNIQDIVGDCRQKLEEWRQDCHKKIDHFFEQKCQELDQLIAEKLDKQQKTISHIRSKVGELIHDQETSRQDIDTLTTTMRQLEKEINKIQQAHLRIKIHPLLMDDTMIQLNEIYQHEIDASAFSSIYKTILRSQGSSRALASNGRLLLVHEKPNLCLLDGELKMVKQVFTPHDLIRDMCWSSALNRFIAIYENSIFLIDDNTMSIETVKMTEKQIWFSCTCFNTQLFLSTSVLGSSIVEIKLSPSIAVIKEWKSPRTCTMDEWIDDIVYNDGTLAVIIRNTVEKSVRMELRSCNTLDRLWSLVLDVVYPKDMAFRCCSLDCNGWLVAAFNTGHLLHITTDGKMKQTITYKAIPHRVTLYNPNILAIAAENSINLHKI